MRMYHYTNMPNEAIGPDAPGSKKRKLNDVESEVSTSMVEVMPGGHTLRHSHPWEQTMFIVDGEGELRQDNGTAPISGGFVIYLRPNEFHFIVNTGQRTLRLLSIEPTQKKA